MAGVLIRRGETQSHGAEKACDNGGREGSDAAVSQEHVGPPETGGEGEGPAPEPSPPPLHWLWFPHLQHHERTHLPGKPASLCQSVVLCDSAPQKPSPSVVPPVRGPQSGPEKRPAPGWGAQPALNSPWERVTGVNKQTRLERART